MEQDFIDKITDFAESFLRYLWLGLCSWILAVTQPLEAVVTLLCWSALLDFIFGFGAARVFKEQFKVSKFIMGAGKVAAIIAITALIYQSMAKFNDAATGLEIAKWICWAGVVVYIINMLKNLKIIFPKSNFFRIAYKVITIDVKDYLIKYIKSKLPKV